MHRSERDVGLANVALCEFGRQTGSLPKVSSRDAVANLERGLADHVDPPNSTDTPHNTAVTELDRFLPGILGAVVGVVGWLVVGVYMQRRQFARQAMNAGRAVYFELLINRMNVVVARDFGSFLPLGRSSFDRLLPELATWLPAEPLQTVVGAYMGHAGYESASWREGAPAELRRTALDTLEAAHRAALDALRPRLFSAREIASLSWSGGPYALSVAPAAAQESKPR